MAKNEGNSYRSGKVTGNFTISRSARSGAFTHITVPGRGEIGVVSAEGFKAAKEAAGRKMLNEPLRDISHSNTRTRKLMDYIRIETKEQK